MSDKQLSTLQQEWKILQTQFDVYEKYSLIIKLFNILITCYLIFALSLTWWPIVVCATIWLQDGIWKTFQARIGDRLEVVELAIQAHLSAETMNSPVLGMQFNSAWLSSRKGAVSLIVEYIKQSLKPTVAYPHLLLLTISIVQQYL